MDCLLPLLPRLTAECSCTSSKWCVGQHWRCHGVLVLFRTPLQWAGGRKPSVELSTGHATWHTQLGCSATPPKRVQRWGPPMLSMLPVPLLLLFAVASQQQQTNKQSQTNKVKQSQTNGQMNKHTNNQQQQQHPTRSNKQTNTSNTDSNVVLHMASSNSSG